MTVIRLDAATLEQFTAAEGRVLLADEAGTPVRACLVFETDPLDREPDLPPEEWRRRAAEPGEMTTAELIEHLRSLG